MWNLKKKTVNKHNKTETVIDTENKQTGSYQRGQVCGERNR